MTMAKSQKRTSREPKKQKDAEKKANKLSGPKYLRQAETLSKGSIAALKIGQRT
jgi:hypothetical protein